jgi:hypothetical protein
VIVEEFKKIVKKYAKREFPQDPKEQLILSRNAVFNSWWAPKASYYRKMEKIDATWATRRPRVSASPATPVPARRPSTASSW